MKWLLRALTALLAIMLSTGAALALAEETNLLTNGGFETRSATGEAEGWYTSAYRTQEGYTRFEITADKAHTGQYSAKITNANENDARYVRTVPVQPETLYRVSGYILVETMELKGNGANIALEEVFAFSDKVFDTQGQWRYVEWYGETGEGQRDVQLGIRIGGYGSESQGTAYFDDITVTPVETLPSGVTATLWVAVEESASNADASVQTSSGSVSGPLWFVLIAVAFLGAVALGGKALLGMQAPGRAGERALLLGFWLAMAIAVAVRVYLGGQVAGYPVDMGCFSAWSLRMASTGPWGFYAPDYFCDYPPGYMLLLWPVGLIMQAVGYADTPLVRLLVKSIPLLCDIAGATVLFRYARKRVPLPAAVFVALLFALNPATLVNGAAWGQVDTVLGLLLLLTAITAMERRWQAALPLFVVAVLVKPQAVLFVPVGGVWLLISFFFADESGRRTQGRRLLRGLGVAAGSALLIVLPFAVGQENPWWLWELYQKTISSYDFATLNTANLLYVLGGNWSRLSGDETYRIVSLSWLVPAITGLLLIGAGAWAGGWQRGLRAVLAETRRAPAQLLNRDGAESPTVGEPANEHNADRPSTEAKAQLARRQVAQAGKAPTAEGAVSAGTADAVRGPGEPQAGGQGRKTLLSLLCLLFGLLFMVSALFPSTFASYGTLWMGFAYLFALAGLFSDRRADTLPFYMALMLMLVYVFGVKIHERYLFAALLLLPLAYTRIRDRRLLWLCAGLSATTFVNTAIVLHNALVYGSSMGHLNMDTLWLNSALGVINVLLCMYGGFVAVTGLRCSQPWRAGLRTLPKTDVCYRTPLLTPADARLRLSGRDYAVMAVAMLLYAALTFTNLGSTTAPQTAWVATDANEQAVFRLEKRETFKLLYYAGVSYSDFSVSVSEDGTHWSDPYPCEMREGLCYRWNYAVTTTDLGDGAVNYNDNNPENIQWFTGVYLRINAETAGLNLWEILLRNADGEAIPLTFVSHTGAKTSLGVEKPPQNLIDEQTTLVGEPSWYNGTYFDEIYHARTAYEHLHGLSPYETTHPPLGKLMMAAAIAVFGMTPFGWRFAGALVGVLMLPALYLLTRQLTRRRDLATFTMVLFSLDLMHFTQTRIATIDSFPVLFILLSVLCMARYLMADAYAVPAGAAADSRPRALTRVYLRSLVPLLLSGLFMGISIACKWIGLYSAVGLAVLFLMAIYRQFRTGLVAFDVDLPPEMPAPQRVRVLWARELTIRRILLTCAFCVVFFIAVPALIYYLSYIPYLSPSGPVSIARIVKAQQGMYAYHSTPGLGMDHPFNSPWWQWPLILKPMWFNQDKFEPAGYASTIMCMGNPLIFYIGALCMGLAMTLFVRKYWSLRDGLRQGDGDVTLAVLMVGFLAQYLPWVLVPRSMYIYHYFASVPFIILATALALDRLRNVRLRRWLMVGYLVLAAVFFALFYPYASGMLTPTAWLDWLKWFPKLYY